MKVIFKKRALVRYFVCIILLFISVVLSAQSIQHEQNALDYFMGKVFKTEYQKVKRIEFGGLTENHLTNLEFGSDCFGTEVRLEFKLADNSANKIFAKKKILISTKYDIKVSRLHRYSNRLKLRIRQANEVNNKSYVTIELTRRNLFVDVYLFELNKSGDVLRWCKTGVVI